MDDPYSREPGALEHRRHRSASLLGELVVALPVFFAACASHSLSKCRTMNMASKLSSKPGEPGPYAAGGIDAMRQADLLWPADAPCCNVWWFWRWRGSSYTIKLRRQAYLVGRYAKWHIWMSSAPSPGNNMRSQISCISGSVKRRP